MFSSVLHHLNFQKPTSQQGEKTREKKNPCRYFETVFNN
jgi:hypothetical protein